jgi:hypothetical protein
MAFKYSKALPDPVNIRLPRELLEEIKRDAVNNERSLSAQVRFLLRMAVAMQQRQAGNNS